MENKISVLFTRSDSVYKKLGCDTWCINRDARLWPGGSAAIYHPPCRAWGNLSHMARPRIDEKELAVWSINQIRKFGGVLEHPRRSKLWSHMNLPAPGKVDEFGGFSFCIKQSWFGHKAEKETILYIVGIEPSEVPDYPISFNCVEYVINSSKKGRKEVTKKEREATPVLFAKWLVALAVLCNKKNNVK